MPAIVAGLLLAGCDAFSSGTDGGTVTLVGVVVDQQQNPIEGAFVEVQPGNESGLTDAAGAYSIQVEIDSTTNVTVTATQTGFNSRSVSVLAVADREVTVPDLELFSTGGTGGTGQTGESGQASNLLLRGQSGSSIGVTESGSVEIAQLDFQAVDSTGRPITLGQSIDISFEFGEQPGGGEFLYPTTVATNNEGVARVNLSSGTISGVVQVVAVATVNGNQIRSLPVAISIHGGHPAQSHFTLGPQSYNFPGFLRFGLAHGIGVLVGDQWSNPARPGTSVYFSANYGVIEGSTLTDDEGMGGVSYFSGNPLPLSSRGVIQITASTADKDQVEVTSTAPLLMTGAPIITITQTASTQDPFLRAYDYTVYDFNLNPMAEGTNISVSATGNKIKTAGNVDTRLGDTVFIDDGDGEWDYDDVIRGPGITDFSFVVVEDFENDSDDPPSLASITISVSGPNGDLTVSIGESGQIVAAPDDVEVAQDGLTTVIRLKGDY